MRLLSGFCLHACVAMVAIGLVAGASFGQQSDSAKKASSRKKKSESQGGSSSKSTAPVAQSAPANAPVPSKVSRSSAPANNASDAQIAAAQRAGQVWVNTNSGVYHKSGRYFGKTKEGKFMREDEAKKAGYREAKGEVGVKK